VEFDYLKTFLEVVKLGSFSRAAAKLAITQPAASFQIQALERELGIRLLDRKKKGVTLTEAGKRLLRFAEVVENEREQLTHDLSQLREDITGNLAIAASTIPGEFLLPSILARFKNLHPTVGSSMVISDSIGIITMIQDGKCEVGFCGIPPQGTDLTSFKIAEDEIVLIVFPEHPFALQDKVSLEELGKQPLIHREETSGTQRSLESMLHKAGFNLKIHPPSLILGSTQSVIAAVEAGLGIAFVSNMAIKKSLALKLLKVISTPELKLKRDFYCVYRKERIVSRLLEEFLAFVRASASQKHP